MIKKCAVIAVTLVALLSGVLGGAIIGGTTAKADDGWSMDNTISYDETLTPSQIYTNWGVADNQAVTALVGDYLYFTDGDTFKKSNLLDLSVKMMKLEDSSNLSVNVEESYCDNSLLKDGCFIRIVLSNGKWMDYVTYDYYNFKHWSVPDKLCSLGRDSYYPVSFGDLYGYYGEGSIFIYNDSEDSYSEFPIEVSFGKNKVLPYGFLSGDNCAYLLAENITNTNHKKTQNKTAYTQSVIESKVVKLDLKTGKKSTLYTNKGNSTQKTIIYDDGQKSMGDVEGNYIYTYISKNDHLYAYKYAIRNKKEDKKGRVKRSSIEYKFSIIDLNTKKTTYEGNWSSDGIIHTEYSDIDNDGFAFMIENGKKSVARVSSDGKMKFITSKKLPAAIIGEENSLGDADKDGNVYFKNADGKSYTYISKELKKVKIINAPEGMTTENSFIWNGKIYLMWNGRFYTYNLSK